MPRPPAPPVFRFGDFVLDTRSRSLAKHGVRLKIHGQPFEILLLLLQSAGEVVTREELQRKLWSNDTFVDFENGLNVAMKKLRQTLGDSVEKPRFIETVPRTGYRFLKTVAVAEIPAPAVQVEAPPQALEDNEVAAPAATPVPPPALLSAPPQRRAWFRTITIAILLAASAAAVVWKFRSRPILALGETDSVLVLDFVNATGDPVFDGTLKQALSVKLAESPYFNLLGDPEMRQTLKLMGRSSDERVVMPLAREVCQRAGAKVIVGGSIVNLGSQYVVSLDATNCLTGNRVDHQEIRAANRDQVINSLGAIISPVRRRLGESLSSIQKFDTPIEQATTKSLAALKAYTSGDEKRSQGKDEESLPLYKMAIELDPGFAIAYARLGTIYDDIGEFKTAMDYTRQAFARREHISEKEKFYIAAHYYADFTRETDKAIETYKLWAQTYPRDWIPFNNVATEYIKIGPPEAAIDPSREALRLNPNHGLAYAGLVQAYRMNTRFAEAKVVAERAVAVRLDGFIVHFNLYMMAFAEGDTAAIQREIAWYKGKPLECWNLNHQAWAAISSGQLRKGRELFERSRASALEHGLREYASATANDEAQLDAELGNRAEAVAKTKLALHLRPESAETQAGAALVFARLGDVERAGQLAEMARKQLPTDARLAYIVFPAIKAAGELRRNQPAAVREELGGSHIHDFGSSGMTPDFIGPYLRGLALLKLGAAQEAAAEFQNIIDHRGVSPTSVYWSLAHLGLGRAYAMDGDAGKSRQAYEEFLTIWKDADPDISILKQAKVEYAKLQ